MHCFWFSASWIIDTNYLSLWLVSVDQPFGNCDSIDGFTSVRFANLSMATILRLLHRSIRQYLNYPDNNNNWVVYLVNYRCNSVFIWIKCYEKYVCRYNCIECRRIHIVSSTWNFPFTIHISNWLWEAETATQIIVIFKNLLIFLIELIIAEIEWSKLFCQ